MSRIAANISNVDCAACVGKLRRALLSLNGVTEVSVGFPSGRAVIELDSSLLGVRDIARCIKKAGFELPAVTVKLSVNDAEIAMEVLREADFVISAEPQPNGAVSVRLWQTDIGITELLAELSNSGITASIAGVLEQQSGKNAQSRQINLIRCALLGAFCLIPLVWQLPAAAKLVFASIVQFVSGAAIYIPALRSIKNRTLSPDVLRAVAISAAYAYMVCGGMGEHWAVPAAITVMLLGKYLEQAGIYAAENSLRRLKRLQPKTARVMRGGAECELGIDELLPADEVIVERGERIPADGVITHGNCTVDEAILTGSGTAIEKYEGGAVTGGTLLREGSIVISDLRTGNGSTLHGIIDRAQTAVGDSPLCRTTGRLAAAAVPAAAILAAAAFMFIAPHDLGAAVSRACAMLMAVSPSALALAAPAALTVGISSAAEFGHASPSAKTLGIARVNTALAALCNIAAIVLTLTGVMSVPAAAVMGAIVPPAVILNSLRARYKR